MFDYESGSEQVLVKRAKRGDRKAFAKLYEKIYIDLYRFAFYTLRGPQDAGDVVSEAVIAAFENIGKLKKTESFRSWMFTIVANKCRKKIRGYQEVRDRESGDAGDMPELGQEPDLAGNHDVHMAFSKLGEEEKLIISMTVLGGYNSREVGQMMNLNDNTVRSKRSRALEKMRQFLA